MDRPVIMTVDDEPQVLGAIARDLQARYRDDYRIVRSGSGQDALETVQAFSRREDAIALFIVDQRMPGMTGTEFLGEALKLYPNAKRVLLTAYADTDAAITSINALDLDYYLLKPWDPPEERLYPVLDDLLGDWHANTPPVYEGIRESLGKYIYLTPQKLGGGTHAVDLAAQKTLAWISYWNYGDSCPISHHLAAFPADSGDAYKGFEFVNTTQGGDNILMYGLRTRIRENGMLGQAGQGNHIYRVGYDGKTGQMELLENIA